MMQTDVAVEISKHVAHENQNQHQLYESESESDYWTTKAEDFDPNQVILNGQTSVYLKLYQAAKKCNSRKAKAILRENKKTIGRSITESLELVLRIAFASKDNAFIKEVVRILTDEDLEQRNIYGDTALCFAAKLGVVTIAEELVEKNNRLPLIRSSEGRAPLCIAVLFGRRNMASYLCTVTSFEGLSPNEQTEILVATITYDMHDITHCLLKTNETYSAKKERTDETLVWYGYNKAAALLELARKPFTIGSKGTRDKTIMPALVEELVLHDSIMVKQFQAEKFSYIVVRNLLFDAAKFGNAEFINKLICTYPHIVRTTDDFHRSLFHIAVIHRQESVFNLIHEIFVAKEVILAYVDAYKQNILHLAGKLAPPSRLNLVRGAGLQMQQEMRWFKKVEKIVPPSYLRMKNSDNLTPWELFTREHENLRVEGEKWMKDAVNFYIVVATLITSVAFAAAFTAPAGSNQDKGSPILLKSVWFGVFYVSDAIALLLSSTSIILFLSILSSDFNEIDFLISLPSDLMTGVSCLFASIAATLLTFIVTCFLVFNSEMKWLPVVIAALAVPPIIFLSWLNDKLFFKQFCTKKISLVSKV